MTIRALESLSQHEIRLVARDQADAGEECMHGFDAGSTQAASFEQAYQERKRELDQARAGVPTVCKKPLTPFNAPRGK